MQRLSLQARTGPEKLSKGSKFPVHVLFKYSGCFYEYKYGGDIFKTRFSVINQKNR